MDWLILSPFVKTTEPDWLMPFIDQQIHRTRQVPAFYEHDRSRKVSSGREWLDYLRHGWHGFVQTFGKRPTGIVTAFPQLAVTVALLKKLSGRKNLPLIAWCFNLAQPYGGIKGKLARFCLPAVDLFVVHSRAEIEIYSNWLQLPRERFVFVPLSAELPAGDTWAEQVDEPYIVALGTANRDYALLAEAAGQLGYKTIIVAGPHATAHIQPPPCVSFRSGLTLAQCHQLALNSRVNVIPIADVDAPSGQVTVIESMMRGVPLVATACAGTHDYIDSGVDGILVKPRDVPAMVSALRTVWDDAELRRLLSKRARQASLDKFSFAAAGVRLMDLMNQLAPEQPHGNQRAIQR
jgi:glycosyltransferase involved in cell wall biosynthesis